jgi:hypothetical protein
MTKKTGRIDTLRGRTIRWSFTDGPTAGTVYEHVIDDDGSIGFRGADKPGAELTRTRSGAAVKISDDVFALSYLSESGFTLTALLNVARMDVLAFASNEASWFQQRGTFEFVDAPA